MSTASERPSGDPRVRLAMSEPNRGRQAHCEGDVPHHLMQPAATMTLKQILPDDAFRSLRRESDVSW
jgi:hypothetical protein